MVFVGEKIVLFSSVNGVLTFHQKPAAGARVMRSVEYKEKIYRDETISAENGSFSLPEMPGPGRIVMEEFIAFQSIEVEYQGQKSEIWTLVKRDHLANRELIDKDNRKTPGMYIDFTCELTTPPRNIELMLAVLVTNCIFPVEIGRVFE